MALFPRRAAVAPARVRRTLLSRGQTLAAIVGLLATTALAVPASAVSESQSKNESARQGTSACTTVESRHARALEQARVLELLKDHRTLRNQADFDRLAAPNPETGDFYFLLPHMFASMKGIGLTIVNAGGGGPGHPTLLFYEPTADKSTDLIDAFGADYPYELVGWGYVSPYTPGQVPTWWANDPGLRCLKNTDWLIHERSVHPSDTWLNIAVPPAEEWAGQAAGETAPTAAECSCPVGLNHGRFWDVHLWISPSGTPSVSMSNPGRLTGGFDPGTGFFYPDRVPSL